MNDIDQLKPFYVLYPKLEKISTIYISLLNMPRISQIKSKLQLYGEEIQMKFTITIYTDEDDVYIVECPSIPGCVSQGKTEEEAEKNVLEAIKECLEVRAELGMPLTVTTREDAI